MTEKKTFFLRDANVKRNALGYVANLPTDDKTPLMVIVKPATRTIMQNDRMWAMLTDLSEQVNWHGNTLTPDNWKDVMTAALKGQTVVPGIEGGFVVLGQRTSQMSKAEMSELMELIAAFGAEHGVVFDGEDIAA